MSVVALAAATALANPTVAPRLDAPAKTCAAAKAWSTVGMIGAGVVTTGVVAPLVIAPNSELGAAIPIVSVAAGTPMIIAGGIGTLAGARNCSHRGRAVSAGIGYLAAGIGAPVATLGIAGALIFAYSDLSAVAIPAFAIGVGAGAVGAAGLGLGLVQTGRLWAVPSAGGAPGLTVGGRF